MLVKAKWNVKDSAGWHRSGEVFNTKEDLGDAVEVLDMPKRQAPAKAPKDEPKQEPAVTEPVKEPEKAPEQAPEQEPETEPEKVNEKPKTQRRKNR